MKGWDSKDPIKRYIVFATNSDDACRELKRIPKEYRKRWGIEAGYRVVDLTRGRTCSRNQFVRMFLFFMTLVNTNMWMTPRHVCAAKQEGRLGVLEMSIFMAAAATMMRILLEIWHGQKQSSIKAGSVMLSPLEIRHSCKGPGPP